MAKGSQLSQLKAQAASAGITDRRQASASSKKRKSPSSAAGAAQRAEAEQRRAALARLGGANPFEERMAKPKHEVLGRVVKGKASRPGAAKAGGLAQRRETLLPELQARHRSGAFLDRRFGEGDASMTPEERMLERFTRERQKGRAATNSLFNLDDGEEEGLTHYGKSLNQLDEMDDVVLGDDDGDIDGLATSQAHFGGFGEGAGDEDEGPERKKSKFEVMQEVMAKSKLAKLERQQMREKDDDIRMELDEGLDDIRALLLGVPSSSTPKPAAKPERAPIPGQEAPEGERELSKEEREKKESDQYDAFVRELAFERRAKPQDRLKTEEELAQEEAEALRKAEEARLRRMRGEEEPKEKIKGKKARRAPGGDDLDDDIDLDEDNDAYGLGKGLGDQEEDADEESEDESEEDEEEGSDEGSEDGSDAGSDEEGSEAASEDAFDDVADLAELSKAGEDDDDAASSSDEAPAALSSSETRGKGKGKSTGAASLPFTFACPATHDELLALLEAHSVSPSDVPLVISRIRALHHASLGEDNKHKLAALIGVLLEHCLFVAPDAAEGGFRLVGKLTPHLFALCTAYPRAAAQHFVAKLALMQRNLSRGLARGALLPQARTWPGVAELTLLRLAGIIFPTSDKTHPVATPLALLIAQYLAHARLRSLRDLASATYLVSLVAAHEREARRLVPEALNALHSVLLILAPLRAGGSKEAATVARAFAIPTPDVGAPHTQHLLLQRCDGDAADEALPSLAALLEVSDDAEDAEQAKQQLLRLCLSLIGEFATLYAGSTAFCELLTPFQQVLALLDVSSLSASLSAQVTSLSATLTRALSLAASQRRALRLQAHRAIPIASHIPKFEQRGYDPSRKGQHDPDTERAAAAKTRALIKKERKGAVKELRRDAQFVAEERRKAKEQEASSYARKMAKVMGSLGEEQREEKVWKREKEKMKKERARQKGGK